MIQFNVWRQYKNILYRLRCWKLCVWGGDVQCSSWYMLTIYVSLLADHTSSAQEADVHVQEDEDRH